MVVFSPRGIEAVVSETTSHWNRTQTPMSQEVYR
jgi:hypothetical protein